MGSLDQITGRYKTSKDVRFMVRKKAYQLWSDPLSAYSMYTSGVYDTEKTDGLESAIFEFIKAEFIPDNEKRFRIWGDLDVSKILPNARLASLVALSMSIHLLSQEEFDFLSCVDISGLPILNVKNQEMYESGYDDDKFDFDLIEFARASIMGMEEDVKSNPPQQGSFVIPREPLEALDDLISYNEIRVVNKANTMSMAFVDTERDMYYNISFAINDGVIMSSTPVLGMHLGIITEVLVMALWRDFSFIYYEDSGDTSKRRRRRYQPRVSRSGKVYLPRVVRRAKWVSDEEGESVNRVLSTRPPHYRTIGHLGWKASQRAMDQAKAHGYAPPPPGKTFVSKAGTGENTQVKTVKCTGFLKASALLNNRIKVS